VEHSASLAIADKGQVIAFAGDLSTSSLLSLQAIYIIPEPGTPQGEEGGAGLESGANEEDDEEKEDPEAKLIYMIHKTTTSRR
jgi:hypothetical protein